MRHLLHEFNALHNKIVLFLMLIIYLNYYPTAVDVSDDVEGVMKIKGEFIKKDVDVFCGDKKKFCYFLGYL